MTLPPPHEDGMHSAPNWFFPPVLPFFYMVSPLLVYLRFFYCEKKRRKLPRKESPKKKKKKHSFAELSWIQLSPLINKTLLFLRYFPLLPFLYYYLSSKAAAITSAFA